MSTAGKATGLLRLLLIIHGLVTLAAGVVLVALPAVIPAMVSIVIQHDAFLLCYFLAAAELAIAALSLGAVRLADRAALRLVVGVIVLLHLTTAILEIAYLSYTAASPLLVANIVVRIIVAALFLLAWGNHLRQ